MPKRSRSAGCLGLILLLVTAGPATAQWASVGDMPAPTRDGNTVTFRNRQGIVAISALAPEIIRVRFSPTPALGRDHSYAVVSRDFGDPRATIATAGQTTTITTAALRMTITHRPFRIAVFDAHGQSLDADDPAMGLAVEIAERLQRGAETQLGNGQSRVQANRFAQLINRRLELSLPLQGQAKVVPSFHMIRSQLDGSLQRGKRPVEILRPPPRRAKMILRVEEPGIQCDRFFELPNRLGCLPLLPEHEAETVMRLGHARCGLDSPGIRGGCLREFLPSLVHNAQEEMRFGGAGIASQCSLELNARPVEIVIVEERPALLQCSLDRGWRSLGRRWAWARTSQAQHSRSDVSANPYQAPR